MALTDPLHELDIDPFWIDSLIKARLLGERARIFE